MIEYHLSRPTLRWLSQQVLHSVRLAGVTYQDVMQQYSPEPLLWAVLPPVIEVFGKRFITKEAVGRVETLELVHADYMATVRWLKKHPWDDYAMQTAERCFAESFLTNTENHPDRLAIYAAEFALNLIKEPAHLVLSDDSAFMRIRESGKGRVFGLYKGKVEGTTCKASAGKDWLMQSSLEQETFKGFDILDKLRMSGVNEQALMLLKLNSEPELLYFLEQSLWETPVVGGRVNSEIPKALRYSKEMYESIELVWDDPIRSDKAKYEELRESLVPEYMSYEYFLILFPAEVLSKADRFGVRRGLQRVKNLFERERNVG